MKRIFLAAFAILMASIVFGEEKETKTSTDNKLKQELIDLENKWMDAYKRKDSVTLAQILADDFTLTSSLSTGELVDKQLWLQGALHRIKADSFNFNKAIVRVYGQTAVVNSWYYQKATFDGRDWSGDFLLTDVWVKKDNRWQVVARHASRPLKPQELKEYMEGKK